MKSILPGHFLIQCSQTETESVTESVTYLAIINVLKSAFKTNIGSNCSQKRIVYF